MMPRLTAVVTARVTLEAVDMTNQFESAEPLPARVMDVMVM